MVAHNKLDQVLSKVRLASIFHMVRDFAFRLCSVWPAETGLRFFVRATAVSPYLGVGMCIMEHLEVLEYSGIFISNPEYRILFRNNLLGAKWADRPEV